MARKMTVQILTLKPAAAEIIRSTATVKVVFLGRRFGKTRMGLVSSSIHLARAEGRALRK